MSDLFSENLAEAIRRSEKNQSEIAALVGITPPYLSDLKKGKRSNPSREIVASLAQALGVSVSWLLTGESGQPESSTLREEPPVYGGAPDALRAATLKRARDFNDSLEPAAERIIQRALRRLDSLFTTAAANDDSTQAGMIRMSHEAVDDFAEEIRELRAEHRKKL